MKRSEKITFSFTPRVKEEYETLPEIPKKELHQKIEEIVGRYCFAYTHYDKNEYVGGNEE